MDRLPFRRRLAGLFSLRYVRLRCDLRRAPVVGTPTGVLAGGELIGELVGVDDLLKNVGIVGSQSNIPIISIELFAFFTPSWVQRQS